MIHDPMIVSLKKPKKPERPDPSMVVRVGKGHLRQQVQKPVRQNERQHDQHVDQALDQFEPQAMPDFQTPARQRPLRRARRRAPGFLVLLTATIVVFVAIGSFVSFTSRATGSNPAYMSQSSMDALIAHVGTLILLPPGQVPTIATVTDLEALKGQAFFDNASVGDKVLMYPKAQKAFLYDPAQDKVIQVAPLTVTDK